MGMCHEGGYISECPGSYSFLRALLLFHRRSHALFNWFRFQSAALMQGLLTGGFVSGFTPVGGTFGVRPNQT